VHVRLTSQFTIENSTVGKLVVFKRDVSYSVQKLLLYGTYTKTWVAEVNM